MKGFFEKPRTPFRIFLHSRTPFSLYEYQNAVSKRCSRVREKLVIGFDTFQENNRITLRKSFSAQESFSLQNVTSSACRLSLPGEAFLKFLKGKSVFS